MMPASVDLKNSCQVLMDKMFQQTEAPQTVTSGVELPAQTKGITELSSLLERCVSYGESNSILIVGSRGSGKTHIVETSLNQAVSKSSEEALIVRLNGLLQTDDNVALEEMTRQLQLDNVVEDLVFGSFEEKLQFLLESLKAGTKNSRPIVFILDEFDLFTNRKSQTLLYNLFDISQMQQTPICVVGLTCRLDITELLEKRVKSRFSHRFIYLSEKASFPQLLSVFTHYLKHAPASSKKKSSLEYRWNQRIDELVTNPQVKDALLFRFNISSDVHSIKQMAALIIGLCAQCNSLPEQKHFLEAFNVLDVDPKASMLQGTSIIELCLIIAMKQLNEIYSDEPFNFTMVYEHYRKFSERKSSMKTCPVEIAMKSFEHLIDLEIVAPVDQSSSALKQYQPMRLMVTNQEIDDATRNYVDCPSDVKHWSYMDSVKA